MKFLFAFLVILGMTRSSLAQYSSTFPEGAGSNFVFYELGDYATNPTAANWNKGVKAVLLNYHLHRPEMYQRLKEMRANGQTKINLFLWFLEDGLKCTYNVYVVCPRKGVIPEQIQQNITGILRDIAFLGFDTVTMRIGGQGKAAPTEDNYDIKRVADAWKLFENLYALSEKATKGLPIKVLYDLGVEVGGHPWSTKPGAQYYMKTMWGNYIKKYPLYKTVGFSFNHAHKPGAIETLRIYQGTGKWPVAVAVDIYEDPDKYLKNLAEALEHHNHKHYPVIIMETYYNSPELMKGFKKARDKYGLSFTWVAQWPLSYGIKGQHSNSPLTPYVYNYVDTRLPLSFLPAKEPHAPSLKEAGTGCADNHCLWVRVGWIEQGSVVLVKSSNGTLIRTYGGKDVEIYPKMNGTHEITLRLQSQNEITMLNGPGLRVSVVNPKGNASSGEKFVQLRAPSPQRSSGFLRFFRR